MPLTLFEETGLAEVGHQSMFSPQGYGSVNETNSPEFKRGLLQTANTFRAIMEGEASPGTLHQLMEAQGTAQFQWYMGHILQRRTYSMYEKMRGDWRPYVRESQVPDFRPVQRLWRNDASAPLPFIQEFEQYSHTGVTGDSTTYQIAKYGGMMGLSWEDLINDDLDFLSDFPQTLANSAVQTEDTFVTNMYASATGPNTSIFNTTAGNLLTANDELGTADNHALSIDSIKAAMFQMQRQSISQDDNKLPIRFSSFHVVVPHRLSMVTEFMANAREIRTKSIAQAKGGNEYEFIMNGNMLGNVQFHVNPYLDILNNTSNAWYVFAVPGNARPGMEVAYLRGHRRPQLFMRAPDSRAIGGGDTRGSLENDTLDYKIRGVFGGAVIDKRQMIASAVT